MTPAWRGHARNTDVVRVLAATLRPGDALLAALVDGDAPGLEDAVTRSGGELARRARVDAVRLADIGAELTAGS